MRSVAGCVTFARGGRPSPTARLPGPLRARTTRETCSWTAWFRNCRLDLVMLSRTNTKVGEFFREGVVRARGPEAFRESTVRRRIRIAQLELARGRRLPVGREGVRRRRERRPGLETLQSKRANGCPWA